MDLYAHERWEYDLLIVRLDSIDQLFDGQMYLPSRLNALSDEGWELVSSIVRHRNDAEELACLLKRRRVD